MGIITPSSSCVSIIERNYYAEITELFRDVYLEISQRNPCHPRGQAQTPGFTHVPPFAQAGRHSAVLMKNSFTAYDTANKLINQLFMTELRVSDLDPCCNEISCTNFMTHWA